MTEPPGTSRSPLSSRRRRRVLLGAVGLVAAVAVITSGGAVLGRRGVEPGQHGQETTPPPHAAPAEAGEVEAFYRPQPERRFVNVGTTNGQQFTDSEYRALTENFGVVLLAKFHGGFDIRLHHEAARRLAALRPDIEVFPYFSARYWFDANKWGGDVIKPEWLLRDNDGETVTRFGKRSGKAATEGAYVDLANPAYRAWALEVLGGWLRAAPYAGVFFDAAEPIGDFGEDEVARWAELLGPERVGAYNQGMRELLKAAEVMVGPDREVVYNGIAPRRNAGEGRNLDLLELTDGALDEVFCLNGRGKIHSVEEDVSLLANQPDDKRLFLRTSYRASSAKENLTRYERFCYGAFLLGWKKHHSYFQFGRGYGAGQLTERHPDLDVNLGEPVAAHEHRGGVAERRFQRGIVYVNFGKRPVTVKLPLALTEVRGGNVLGSYEAGGTISVPGEDARFLIDPKSPATPAG